jgi:DNA polymerase-3 subunit chi
MTRINFAFGAPERLQTACQVARKRYQAGEYVIVFCPDARRLAAFDRLLWTFDDIAFVPHVMADDPLATHTPVILTANGPIEAASVFDSAKPLPWLLNLSDECPPDYDRFERILEIVSDDPDDRQSARQRWRVYQSAGHDVRSHNLAKAVTDQP